jgi:hypothetical protein
MWRCLRPNGSIAVALPHVGQRKCCASIRRYADKVVMVTKDASVAAAAVVEPGLQLRTDQVDPYPAVVVELVDLLNRSPA